MTRNMTFKAGRIALTALLIISIITASFSGSTLAVLVTKTDTLVNRFVSGVSQSEGNLVIHKTVTHPFGDTYRIPENDNTNFSFSVSLGEENAGGIFGEYKADDSGNLSVNVRADSSVTISGIPADTNVTVQETEPGSGFTNKPAEGADSSGAQSAVIEGGGTKTLTFTNSYSPAAPVREDRDVSVTGEKDLVGRSWKDGDSFTFELEEFQDGSWKSLGDSTVTARSGGSGGASDDARKFDLTDAFWRADLSSAGMYSFRVREIEGSIGGIAYDRTESKFDVAVGDADMDGKLEIQSITSYASNTSVDETAKGLNVDIKFSNTYAPEGSAEAAIEITKILKDTGGGGKLPEGFEFELIDEDGNVAQTSEPTSAAGLTDIRIVLTPDDAGKTYAYTLREKDGGAAGVTYDDSVIKIYVSAVDNGDGTISAYIYDEDQKATVPERADEADTAEDGQTENSADAVDSGEDITDNSPEDGKSGETDKAENSAESDNTDNGNETKDEDTSGSDGSDGAGDEAGDEAGNASEPGRKDEVEGASEAKPGDSADDPADNDESNESDETSGNTSSRANQRPVNAQGGTYTGNAGSHVRLLSAQGNGSAAYTASGQMQLRTNTINLRMRKAETDQNSGAGSKSEEGTGQEAERSKSNEVTIEDIPGGAKDSYEAAFTNTYTPAAASVTVSGTKTLSGREMKAGEFGFALYSTDEDFAVGDGATPVKTAENGADGAFNFGSLIFNRTGAYYYAVAENTDNKLDNVSYDESVYGIKITVTDDGAGHLDAAMEAAKDGNYIDEIVFANAYTAPSEPEGPSEPEKPTTPEEPANTSETSTPAEPSEPAQPSAPAGHAASTDSSAEGAASAGSSASGSGQSSGTGDTADIALYASVLTASLICIVFCAVWLYRHRKQK